MSTSKKKEEEDAGSVYNLHYVMLDRSDIIDVTLLHYIEVVVHFSQIKKLFEKYSFDICLALARLCVRSA